MAVQKPFSYVYVAGPDGVPEGPWMKIGVTGNPVQRLGNIRGVYSIFAELHYIVQVPPDLVMLVETCAHTLLSDKRIETGNRFDKERFSVSAKEASHAVDRAAVLVSSGEFTARMAVEYCKSLSPRYHGQRRRPRSTSLISPADIKLPFYRYPPVIRTFEQVLGGSPMTDQPLT